MQKTSVLIVLCCILPIALFAIWYAMSSSDSKEDQYYDIATIIEDHQLSEYELITRPGPPGPYKVLDIQRFAPGQEVTGTVTVGNFKYTLRCSERNHSDEETVMIIFQTINNGGIGAVELRPSRGFPSEDSIRNNSQTPSGD